MTSNIPFPPHELRRIVGPTEDIDYDNPSGDLVWGDLSFTGRDPKKIYEFVLDFGCGCGRNARQLMLQRYLPQKYIGIDISRKLIEWCANNLTPHNRNFQFYHHDVFSITYAPENSKARVASLPAKNNIVTLFNAHSVFTHLHYDQTEYYLKEAKRILIKGGIIRSTWFLIDKRVFPVMAKNQNCVYVNEIDPTQAVYYDICAIFKLFSSLGLAIIHVEWTKVYGFQSVIYLGKNEEYKDISHGLEIPETIVGININPDRILSSSSFERMIKSSKEYPMSNPVSSTNESLTKNSYGSETSRCRERLKKYCVGYGLDLGYGGDPIVPSVITMDLPIPYARTGTHPLNLGGDAKDLCWFRSNTLDYVYSSHLLEDFENTEAVLREWLRVIKIGGYLILFCPNEQVYRKHCQETGQSYNSAHKIENFSIDHVKHILEGFHGIEIIHENPLVDIYSFELVIRKISATHVLVEKDQAIARYREELYSVYTSRSWRYTTPLRKIGTLIRRVLRLPHKPRIRAVIKRAYFMLPAFIRKSRLIENLKNRFKSKEVIS